MNLLITVSFYEGRSSDQLIELLGHLDEYRDDLLLVINRDEIPEMQFDFNNIRTINNKNLGMNIGAWNAAFQAYPDKDLYLFLQDECFLKRTGFLTAIKKRFENDRSLGMLGESLNLKWAYPWSQLESSALNSHADDHYVNGLPGRRVECYLRAMHSWGINPGSTGAHLRSLFWSFPGSVLRELGGFPVGFNRGGCIAAEIGVSRKVESLGYTFDQISGVPFSFFGHSEWRADGVSKVII